MTVLSLDPGDVEGFLGQLDAVSATVDLAHARLQTARRMAGDDASGVGFGPVDSAVGRCLHLVGSLREYLVEVALAVELADVLGVAGPVGVVASVFEVRNDGSLVRRAEPSGGAPGRSVGARSLLEATKQGAKLRLVHGDSSLEYWAFVAALRRGVDPRSAGAVAGRGALSGGELAALAAGVRALEPGDSLGSVPHGAYLPLGLVDALNAGEPVDELALLLALSPAADTDDGHTWVARRVGETVAADMGRVDPSYRDATGVDDIATASPVAAAAFFEGLGAHGVASLPGYLGLSLNDQLPAGRRRRRYSIALGQASQTEGFDADPALFASTAPSIHPPGWFTTSAVTPAALLLTEAEHFDPGFYGQAAAHTHLGVEADGLPRGPIDPDNRVDPRAITMRGVRQLGANAVVALSDTLGDQRSLLFNPGVSYHPQPSGPAEPVLQPAEADLIAALGQPLPARVASDLFNAYTTMSGDIGYGQALAVEALALNNTALLAAADESGRVSPAVPCQAHAHNDELITAVRHLYEAGAGTQLDRYRNALPVAVAVSIDEVRPYAGELSIDRLNDNDGVLTIAGQNGSLTIDLQQLSQDIAVLEVAADAGRLELARDADATKVILAKLADIAFSLPAASALAHVASLGTDVLLEAGSIATDWAVDNHGPQHTNPHLTPNNHLTTDGSQVERMQFDIITNLTLSQGNYGDVFDAVARPVPNNPNYHDRLVLLGENLAASVIMDRAPHVGRLAE